MIEETSEEERIVFEHDEAENLLLVYRKHDDRLEFIGVIPLEL